MGVPASMGVGAITMPASCPSLGTAQVSFWQDSSAVTQAPAEQVSLAEAQGLSMQDDSSTMVNSSVLWSTYEKRLRATMQSL
jgi:hypothetical protein